jgi:hypothetical protein
MPSNFINNYQFSGEHIKLNIYIYVIYFGLIKYQKYKKS